MAKLTEHAPPFPAHVSSNGSEIWDWAIALSRHEGRLREMRRLRERIAEVGTKCGDCDHWMKSRQCPKEHNVNGYSRGPHMNHPTCRQFSESSFATKLRTDLTAGLTALKEQEKGE